MKASGIVFILCVFCASLCGNLWAKPADYDAAVRKPKDTAHVRHDGDTLIINIHSDDGIGGATVRSRDGRWPAKVLVRLDTRSLESFGVSNGKMGVSGALGRPFWVCSREGIEGEAQTIKAAIVKRDEFIEVELPALLFDGAIESLSISWIDAYR